MIVMIVLTQLYGVLELAVLGWITRSVRWRVLVTASASGVYAAAGVAVVTQVAWTRVFSAVTGVPTRTVTAVASYTVDPVIEELAKLLPSACCSAVRPT